jgi:hypothetical protein
MSAAGPHALDGGRVQRIHWVPGSDQLRAECHCGAERLFEDPVELWDWLLGHPDGHHAPPGPAGPPPRDRDLARLS